MGSGGDHKPDTGRLAVSLPEACAALFVIWAALSLLWTPDKGEGALQLLNFVSVAVVFVAVSRGDIAPGIAYGCALGILGALTVRMFIPSLPYGGFGNRNFINEFIMIALPLAAVAGYRTWRWPFGLVSALLGALYLVFVDDGHAKYIALLSLGAGIGLWCIVNRKWLAAIIVVLVPFNAVVWFAVNPMAFYSLRTRIELTVNTLIMWLEKPIAGHGIGSYNYVYPSFQERHVEIFGNIGTFLQPFTTYAGAAHNEWAQLLAEYGLVGFAIVAALLWASFARPGFDYRRAAAAASVAAAAGNSLVGFPLQNPAAALVAVAALGIVARGAHVSIRIPSPFRFAAPVFATALALSAVYVAPKWFHSWRDFTQARYALMNGAPAHGFISNMQSVRHLSWDWLPRYQLSLTLLVLVTEDSKSQVAPGAADRIYELSRTASPWSAMLAVSRVLYLVNSGRAESDNREIEDNMTLLRERAALQDITWMLEAQIAGISGDAARVERALGRGIAEGMKL